MRATFLHRLFCNQRANISILFGLAVVPMVFVTGMGIDYTSAAYKRDQLDAYADSAALAAVTPEMMAQGDAQSVNAAQQTFNAQASSITGLNYNPANLTVSVADSGTTRTVTVSYRAASQNAFLDVLGIPTIALAGSSTATTTAAPNIDFYMLLDASPSMAIAATQSGIDTMVANTANQGGCAFGCHEAHPSSDNLGNPGGIDNYTLARDLGVTLRIDMLREATQNLMTTAAQTSTANNAKYRMAIYTFDNAFNTIQPLTPDLSQAQTAAGNISLLEVYANNWLTSRSNNSDEDTNYDNAMSNINVVMPSPGNGGNATSDTPQEVLFFVTDGVEDENAGGHRQQSLMSTSWCSAVKTRGIKIAVLYTDYLPLPTNAWYNAYIAPFQNQIGPRLQSCASPGLYFEVNAGQDISAAMNALFEAVVQSARLSR